MTARAAKIIHYLLKFVIYGIKYSLISLLFFGWILLHILIYLKAPNSLILFVVPDFILCWAIAIFVGNELPEEQK